MIGGGVLGYVFIVDFIEWEKMMREGSRGLRAIGTEFSKGISI